MDIFDSKNIKPMLIGKEGQPFDSTDFLYELKLDGERCIAYLDLEGTELRNKRNQRMLSKVPELSQIHKQAQKKCILDGELIVLKNGKPDFFEIQRRSLMSNRFRIELLSKQYPATFTAFDILYYNGEQVTALPLLQRKQLLSEAFKENERLALSRTVEKQGIAFFNLARENELEGIVAKRKSSLYRIDTRTSDWIKIKHMLDDDFVVCGFIQKDKGFVSIVLGQYREMVLLYKGHVTMGVSRTDYEILLKAKRTGYPPFIPPKGNEEAVWLAPELVCTVKYMPRPGSKAVNHPVFKGLRTDKHPEECIEST